MDCKHERLKSVNCVIFCDVCGAKLPEDYLFGKSEKPEAPAEPVSKPEEAPKATNKRTTKKGAK